MDIQKIIRARPPVMYRWLRRRRYLAHVLVLALALISLPVGIVGGARLSGVVTTSEAMAATRAVSPEHSVLDAIPEKDRAQYAQALSGLVIDDPRTLYRLIGPDFLVMFHEPDLARRDGDAVVWQYRTDTCVLDLFFDSAGSGDAPGAVTHYEVRPRLTASLGKGPAPATGAADSVSCLESLYRQRSA